MASAKFDASVDVEIRETIERAKLHLIEKEDINPEYALKHVTIIYIVNCAEGLNGLSSYMHPSHIRGATTFLLHFRNEKKINWKLVNAMSRQIVENEETYFPEMMINLILMHSDIKLRDLKVAYSFNLAVKNLMLRALGFSEDESIDIRLSSAV